MSDTHRIECPDSRTFCLNGGSCPQTPPVGTTTTTTLPPPSASSVDPTIPPNCQCPIGYTGSHCEQQMVCRRECLNGGQCVWGGTSTDDPFHSHAAPHPNEPYNDNNMDDDDDSRNMLCECSQGYAGDYCEYRIELCGEQDPPEHICLHGARCIPATPASDTTTSVVATATTTRTYRCECASNDSECQTLKRTEFCMPDPRRDTATGLPPAVEYYGGMAVPVFCFNGGRCVDVFADDHWHASCECHPFFEGPHCEFIKSQFDLAQLSTRASSSRRHSSSDNTTHAILEGFISLIIAMGSGVLIWGVWFTIRQIRRVWKRRGELDHETNLQAFRDNTDDRIDDENDIAMAFSPNGNMLFPAFGAMRPAYRDEPFVLRDIDLS